LIKGLGREKERGIERENNGESEREGESKREYCEGREKKRCGERKWANVVDIEPEKGEVGEMLSNNNKIPSHSSEEPISGTSDGSALC
jgi:hypothetical protein